MAKLGITVMRRLAEREVQAGGGRVRRPAGSSQVDIAYLRTHPGSSIPVVVIPGGPGLASALPYRALRRDRTARDLDLVMMEHRGVGLSRFDTTGRPLDRSAVTITAAVDDLAAVLDDAGIERAVIYGSSYGTYLAGLRRPPPRPRRRNGARFLDPHRPRRSGADARLPAHCSSTGPTRLRRQYGPSPNQGRCRRCR